MSADNRPALRKELLEYCDRVPPRINSGSYNQAIEFKAAVIACRKLAKKPTATEHELISAINRLNSYW